MEAGLSMYGPKYGPSKPNLKFDFFLLTIKSNFQFHEGERCIFIPSS